MKNKLLVWLLLVGLLLSMSGTALAQGPRPPLALADAVSLKKSEAGLTLKAGNNAQALNAGISELAVATTQVLNGDFEQGRYVGWGESSALNYYLVLPSSDTAVHNGSWAAWLGGDDQEIAYIYQNNISIVSPTSLRLWYLTYSLDDCGYDYGYVLVNDIPIYTWNLCQSTNTSDWMPLDLSLNSYNGQTINLKIKVTTDIGYYSNLFIDDVSLYQTFADVPYGHWSESYIHRLYNAGITGGCGTSPLMYCPGATVTRDQMAIFLLRGAHYPTNYVPPAASGMFTDVPASYWAASWIEQLAADGITGGCGAGNYCPALPVTRDQMAVFLLRAKNGPNYTPPAVGTSTGFTDVPTSYWAAAWIKELAAQGITGGCGNGNYCPSTPVTRDQMAVFLVKAFNLP